VKIKQERGADKDAALPANSKIKPICLTNKHRTPEAEAVDKIQQQRLLLLMAAVYFF